MPITAALEVIASIIRGIESNQLLQIEFLKSATAEQKSKLVDQQIRLTDRWLDVLDLFKKLVPAASLANADEPKKAKARK